MPGSLVKLTLLGALVVAAFAFVPAATAAPLENPAEKAAPASAECAGPCPIAIFGLGNTGGTVEVVTQYSDRPSELAICNVAPGNPCDIQIDEFSLGALLQPTSAGFRGWWACPQPRGKDCFIPVFSGAAACVAFTRSTGDPIPSTVCPPPFVQFYKKGDGRGTVTASSGSTSQTCGPLCPAILWTQFPGGSSITLTATPSEGSFVRWEGPFCASATGPMCTFTLSSTATVCAVFLRTPASPLDPNCPATTGTNPQPRDLRPNTRITAGPSPNRATRSRRATFRFVSSEARSRFLCRIDRRAWRSCKSPKRVRNLKPGVHAFRVRAIDRAGQVDRTPAIRRWRIRA